MGKGGSIRNCKEILTKDERVILRRMKGTSWLIPGSGVSKVIKKVKVGQWS